MQARGLGVFVEKALERVQSERRRGGAFWGVNATRDGMPLLEGGGERDEEEEEERERKRRRGENQKKEETYTHEETRQGRSDSIIPQFTFILTLTLITYRLVVCGVCSQSQRATLFLFISTLSFSRLSSTLPYARPFC